MFVYSIDCLIMSFRHAAAVSPPGRRTATRCRLRPHPRPRVRDQALRRALGVGGMSSAVSTGAFLTTVCLAHLVLGALMGVLVHEFGADMLSLWPVGPALCH